VWCRLNASIKDEVFALCLGLHPSTLSEHATNTIQFHISLSLPDNILLLIVVISAMRNSFCPVGVRVLCRVLLPWIYGRSWWESRNLTALWHRFRFEPWLPSLSHRIRRLNPVELCQEQTTEDEVNLRISTMHNRQNQERHKHAMSYYDCAYDHALQLAENQRPARSIIISTAVSLQVIPRRRKRSSRMPCCAAAI
jgi:hypothetical protein